MPRGIVALVFRARVVGGTAAHRTDETTEMQWLSTRDITDRCVEAYAVRVLDALNDTGTVVRAHDGVSLLGAEVAPPSRHL